MVLMNKVNKNINPKPGKLLVIFPHPDDETVMSSGLILKALKNNWQVKVVCLTEGSRGKVHIHGRGRSVAEMRREEFVSAMKILGVGDYEMWKEEDAKLRVTKLWRLRVRRLVDYFEPDLVVSYDLSGVTGHPDHVELGLEMFRLFKEKGFSLWWPVPDGLVKKRFTDPRLAKYFPETKHSLWLSVSESMKKWRAVYTHLSQGMGKEFGWTFWITAFKERRENYAVAEKKKYSYKRVKFEI